MINGVSASSSALYAQWLQQQKQSGDASSLFSLPVTGAANGAAADSATSGTGGLQLSSDLLTMLQAAADPSSSNNTAASAVQSGHAMPHHHYHHAEGMSNQSGTPASTNASPSPASATPEDQGTTLDSLLSSALSA